MAQTVEAVFENGVFVPAQRPALSEHERVRLLIEPLRVKADAGAIERRRRNRIKVAPDLAQEIALSAEFDPNE
jgi:predicted DNA-binding antitoxin AbrB/MazE fold protein